LANNYQKNINNKGACCSKILTYWNAKGKVMNFELPNSSYILKTNLSFDISQCPSGLFLFYSAADIAICMILEESGADD
jgi:hypothetical protein